MHNNPVQAPPFSEPYDYEALKEAFWKDMRLRYLIYEQEISPRSFSSGPLPPTPRTTQPESPRGHPEDAVTSPSGSRERQSFAEPADSIEASHSVSSSENGWLQQLKQEKEAAPLDNVLFGIGDKRRERARRRRKNVWGYKLYCTLAILAILTIAGIITAVTVSKKNHRHSTVTTDSATTIQINSIGTNGIISTQVLGQSNSSASVSSLFSGTSHHTNTASKSSALKVPTSNTTSTTSASPRQTLSTSYTSAVPESTCTTNCQVSTPPSSAPTSSNSPNTATSAVTPTPMPKPATASKPVSCGVYSNCPNGLVCDYQSSTCFLCTYATDGMLCSGGQCFDRGGKSRAGMLDVYKAMAVGCNAHEALVHREDIPRRKLAVSEILLGE
ncbi:hypothetical protein BDZ45DRAFT_807837 [Acephala macrosclerotiorum]|nr:hypothetical protein BDZ45DRAFT_807837 [Acephala macrosclerotiorum]